MTEICRKPTTAYAISKLEAEALHYRSHAQEKCILRMLSMAEMCSEQMKSHLMLPPKMDTLHCETEGLHMYKTLPALDLHG